jgi:acid phosphatase family membrane protein YuiD
VLNQIVCELPSEHPLSETRPLRELLGHTPTQVCSNAIFTNHFIILHQSKAMSY